ncbi:MAG TPA: polysaccharide deacetylase family protein [Dissulfurispiraceae bacterium]
MKLIITIDTEEDNWGNYRPMGYTLENIRKIPALQDIFDVFGVKPTYLVTYSVAKDRKAVSVLKAILDEGRCEIGAHCHPWHTPPFEELPNERTSMLCNLPGDLQFRKLRNLHNTIISGFNVTPVSFRAGRWGYNRDVAANIHRLGYKVDSSVTPYTDWTNSHGPDFTKFSPKPFRFSPVDILRETAGGGLVEVPATIGFLQQNFSLCSTVLAAAQSFPMKYLKAAGILCRLSLVNKAWLSPEVSDSATMIKLARRMMQNRYRILNLVFHSPTLMAGVTPFVRTSKDERRFLEHIRDFLSFARGNGIGSMKLSEISGVL